MIIRKFLKPKGVSDVSFFQLSQMERKKQQWIHIWKIQEIIVLIFILRQIYLLNFPCSNSFDISKKKFYKLRYFLFHLRHPVCLVHVITPLSTLRRCAILCSYWRLLMPWVPQKHQVEPGDLTKMALVFTVCLKC